MGLGMIRSLTALILAAAITLTPQAAAAQAADQAVQVEDIIVTARRSGAPMWEVTQGDRTLILVGAITPPRELDWRPDALEATRERLDAAGRLDRVKLIYVVSDFDNPSGYTLAADRRREVVAIAERWSRSHRIHVMEDAAYRELRYDGTPAPSLLSCDPAGETVIYAGTFSKSFSPGLRVGFGHAVHRPHYCLIQTGPSHTGHLRGRCRPDREQSTRDRTAA